MNTKQLILVLSIYSTILWSTNATSTKDHDFLVILDTIDKHYIEQLKDYGITNRTILAIILTESNFNKQATSHKGARGLMGIMPITAKQYQTNKEALYDIDTNIKTGIKHLQWLSKRHKTKEGIIQHYFWGNKPQLHNKYYEKVNFLEQTIK